MLGVFLMLLAALLNATSSVLQRRVTKSEPESAAFSVQLLLDIVRRPGWLFGVLVMLSGFILHAVSISVSRIALVQPLLVAELPFALVLASFVFHVRITKRDWIAVGLQTFGLAAFVGCLAPQGGDPNRVPALVWGIGAGATVLAVAVLVVLGYRGRREHRAALLGVATGAAFGLNSSLIAGVGAAVGSGANLFTTWQTYGVAVVGPASFFLLQNALSSGNLVASQPGFTLTNPLVSVAWGLAVFGEQGRQGAFLIGTIVGAVLIGVGTVYLARSPLLNPDSQRSAEQHEDRDTKPVQES